jgi:hypothetical protein
MIKMGDAQDLSRQPLQEGVTSIGKRFLGNPLPAEARRRCQWCNLVKYHFFYRATDMKTVNLGGVMNRKKGLPTATIILYAMFVTFVCLACGFDSEKSFDGLRKAKVPIYLPELEPTTSTQDYKVALNFGIAIGDALACIYNEDQAASPRYMGMIHDYGKKLGISETVLRKLGGITAAMNQGDWQEVLNLSEDFVNKVADELEKAGKKDEFSLALVAWNLEGLYITAKTVDKHFSPESAKLLRNAEFVKNQEEDLKILSVGLQTKQEVKAIKAAQPKINDIINRPENYTYTRTDARELISICEPLRKTMLSD